MRSNNPALGRYNERPGREGVRVDEPGLTQLGHTVIQQDTELRLGALQSNGEACSPVAVGRLERRIVKR